MQALTNNDEFIALCKSGNASEIEAAIMNSADINAKINGVTGLMWAVCENTAESTELLLKHGAETDAKDKNGATALMMAAWFGRTGAAELLIEHGADVNAQDHEGRTALMRAAWNGRTEIIELLLKHGADVNVRDQGGKTALMFARRTDTAGLLRSYGA